MKWATRAGIHIDRASSAWLLRRFVDPGATFVLDDETVLALTGPVFDGLYEYDRRSLILGTDTPT